MNKMQHVFSRIAAYKNWYTLVWPLTRILPVTRVLRPRQGMKMEVRSVFGEDFVVAHEMFSRDDYQLLGLRPTHTPPIVVDAGANVGAFSIFASSIFKGARIYALEPEKRNFGQLQRNIALNKLEALITPINAGINVASGSYDFFLSTEEYAHSLLESAVSNSMDKKITIPCLSLRDIMTQHNLSYIDILKLDIEGTEYELLPAVADILPNVGAIVLEIHDRAGFVSDELLRFIREQGYTVEQSPTRGNVYRAQRIS